MVRIGPVRLVPFWGRVMCGHGKGASFQRRGAVSRAGKDTCLIHLYECL